MRLRSLVPALLAALAMPFAAFASPWETSLAPAAVGSYLSGEAGTIVVGAGAPSADLSEAEAALAAALRASGKARVVMDDAALGDVSALDDAAIVERARRTPAQRIAVVRVFPGAVGVPPAAVVTFYQREGAASSAFSVERGSVLASNLPDGPGQGASVAATRAAAEVRDTVKVATAEAVERYEREHVWFEDWAAVRAGTGIVVSTWTVPYQGKYKKNIDGPEFFEVVGRPDLADDYRTRRAWRVGGYVGGSLAAIGGIFALMAGVSEKFDCDSENTDREIDDPPRPLRDCSGVGSGKMIAGGLLSGGGMLAFTIASFTSSYPVDAVESRRLADEYNQRLKRELGLAAREEERSGGVRAGLAAMPGGGAGLSLAGTLP